MQLIHCEFAPNLNEFPECPSGGKLTGKGESMDFEKKKKQTQTTF